MSASLSAPFAHTSQLSKGGRTFTYVAAAEVIERLNACLGYGNWSYECETAHVDPDFVVVKGRLSALGAVYEQYGGQKINKTKAGDPIDLGDDFKGAASDAEKKCAAMIGVALYLALGRNPTPFSQSGDQPSPEPEVTPSGGDRRAPEPPITQGAPVAESSTNDDQGVPSGPSQRTTSAVVGGAGGDATGEAPSPPDDLKGDLKDRISRLTNPERLKLKALWIANLAPLDSAEVDEDYFNQAVGLIGQAAA